MVAGNLASDIFLSGMEIKSPLLFV